MKLPGRIVNFAKFAAPIQLSFGVTNLQTFNPRRSSLATWRYSLLVLDRSNPLHVIATARITPQTANTPQWKIKRVRCCLDYKYSKKVSATPEVTSAATRLWPRCRGGNARLRSGFSPRRRKLRSGQPSNRYRVRSLRV